MVMLQIVGGAAGQMVSISNILGEVGWGWGHGVAGHGAVADRLADRASAGEDSSAVRCPEEGWGQVYGLSTAQA